MKQSQNSEKQKIAIKMANHFEKTFTNSQLVLWHMQANCLLHEHYDGIQKDGEAVGFLASFEWHFTRQLLDSKPSIRNSAIESGLLDLFSSVCYDNFKVAISEIGKSFLTAFAKLSYDHAKVNEFMNQLSCFMELAEMYGDYEALEKKEWNKTKVLRTANDIIAEIFKPLNVLQS